MTVKPDPSGFPQRKAAEVPTVSAVQMRDIQRIAQEDFGYDILQMMENGGRAIAKLALEMLGGKGHGQSIVVMAGGGNKGGCGLVAARHLVNWGFRVDPIFGEMESEFSYPTRRQLELLRLSGVVEPGDEQASEITLEDQLQNSALVIDALLGYGRQGPPTGIAAAAVELAMGARKPILAVDVPTGVDATTGEPYRPAIRALTTLALDLPKRGIYETQARPYVGELFLADLGIPQTVHERLGISTRGLFTEGPIIRVKR